MKAYYLLLFFALAAICQANSSNRPRSVPRSNVPDPEYWPYPQQYYSNNRPLPNSPCEYSVPDTEGRFGYGGAAAGAAAAAHAGAGAGGYVGGKVGGHIGGHLGGHVGGHVGGHLGARAAAAAAASAGAYGGGYGGGYAG